jgi:hypothetical protein
MTYEKSEFGWLIILLFFPIVAFLPLAYIYQWGNHPISLTPMMVLSGIMVFIALLFYKLRIKIDEGGIHLIYGIGLIRKNIRPDRVDRVQSMKTPWYYGLGIRITPKGILYNIHSLKAVKIDYIKRGRQKTIMIGTPQPEGLREFLTRKYITAKTDQ